MINYAHTVFNRVVSSYLKDGYTPQELITVVNKVAATSATSATAVRAPVGYVPLYDDVPPDLMTVAEVVAHYGITRQAVFGWIRAGHISEAGILRYAASGQRNITLVNRDAVSDWITMDMENNMRIYDSVPDGLATLATVEQELGINRRTVRAWINRGHIPKRGLLRGAARRGGMILVSPRDVLQLAESKSLRQNGHTHINHQA